MTARRTAITCASAACLALTLPAVKKSEGYWPTVKVDTVGTGRPCTGGYGETENVKCGETHTEAYWSDRLKMRLADEYDREIGKCIHVDLPDSARAAMITTAYNAGSAAVCRSPMVAKMNADDVEGGCKALAGWYIRAQGRVLKGLINRRRDDMKLCLAYLHGESNGTKAISMAAAINDAAPKAASAPYVCAPHQAEAGECLPLVRHVPLPKPRPVAASAPVRPWYWWVFK